MILSDFLIITQLHFLFYFIFVYFFFILYNQFFRSGQLLLKDLVKEGKHCQGEIVGNVRPFEFK